MQKFTQRYLWGLLVLGLISLVWPSATQAQCIDQGKVWTNSWTSCQTSPNPNPAHGVSHWILYEFATPHSIDSSHVWNANRPGESTQGIKTAEIDYSVDGSTWQHLGTYTFPQASEQGNYAGFAGPNFGGIFIKKILITVTETYGSGNCASLAEVQFNLNEDACYGELDACGVCNGGGETLWYVDSDGDGKGSPNVVMAACDPPQGYVANADDPCDNGMSGWPQVYQIFSENGCTGCHGTNALGGLNLTSYETAVMGGNKCGPGILDGTTLVDIISVDQYAGCGPAIAFPSMNARTGMQIDSAELATLQEWINANAPYDCNCVVGAPDQDFDGICDYIDPCPTVPDSLIGTPCDDGLSCTTNDVWTDSCTCTGQIVADNDQDGICDSEDLAPNNPCTADGIVDGVEPPGWVAQPDNDCDLDQNTVLGGDLNDFDACVDQRGSVSTAACNCGPASQPAGGTLAYANGIHRPERAEGLPDGSYTGGMFGNDTLILDLPYVGQGEQVCIQTEYTRVPNDGLRIDANGYLFTLIGDNSLTQQQLCFTVRESGPQRLILTENGAGGIRIDGVTIESCPCMDSTLLNPDPLTASGYSPQSGWQVVGEDGINVCAGDSLVLTLGNNPNQIFEWSGPQLGTVSGHQLTLGAVTAAHAGLYTAAYQNAYGCTVRRDVYVMVEEAPEVEVNLWQPTCSDPFGGAITFAFQDGAQHSHLEFSMMGEAGPYQRTADNIGLFSFADLNSGTYDLWVRWSEDHCPTDLGTVTLSSGCEGVALKAFLQGPYAGDSMQTQLAGQLPLTDPYLGTASLSALPDDVVDWVLVQVRNGANVSQVIAEQPCLLRKDGQLIDPAGDTLLVLGNNLPAFAYLALLHRNHLGVITAEPVALAGSIDFGDPALPVAGKTARHLDGPRALLRSGDANGDGVVNAIDQNLLWRPRNGQAANYGQGGPDFNLDGRIDLLDRNTHWLVNNGHWSAVPR